jgi:hypothetical protein
MSDGSKLRRHGIHSTAASIRTATITISSAAIAFVALQLLITGFDNKRDEVQPSIVETPKFEICTYFEPLGLNEENDNKTREMLDIWRESWANNGWGTRVLTSKDAALHPRHNMILETLLKLPTVNAQAYEMACYLRWVAAIATGCTVRVTACRFNPPARNH